ncbi:MAG: aminotransferase class IV [Bacteroidota bacterium]
MKINLNGKLIPHNQPIFSASNRAFLYGDALFETIRMFDGKLSFLEDHVNRLLRGLDFFHYKIPKKYTTKFFQKEIKKIADGNARIRLTVFRTDGGLYTPKNNKPQFLISASPLPDATFQLHTKGLEMGIFRGVSLARQPISNHKTCNSLPYIRAAIFKKEQNLNDVFLLNDKGRIAEASSSNVFIFKKNQLITPSLSEGCITGTMRLQIIRIAQQLGIKVLEKKVTLATLEASDEIWLTNSIQGIRWVAEIPTIVSLRTPTLVQPFVHHLNLLTN